MVGIITSTVLNGFIRKKILMEAAMIASVICFSLALLVENLTVMIVILCFNFAFQIGAADLVVCFLTETVLE